MTWTQVTAESIPHTVCRRHDCVLSETNFILQTRCSQLSKHERTHRCVCAHRHRNLTLPTIRSLSSIVRRNGWIYVLLFSVVLSSSVIARSKSEWYIGFNQFIYFSRIERRNLFFSVRISFFFSSLLVVVCVSVMWCVL